MCSEFSATRQSLKLTIFSDSVMLRMVALHLHQNTFRSIKYDGDKALDFDAKEKHYIKSFAVCCNGVSVILAPILLLLQALLEVRRVWSLGLLATITL